MKESIVKDSEFAVGLKSFGPVYREEAEDIKLETPFDELLQSIFSVDKFTGLPRGDIAYYYSPQGNQEIRQWLDANLMKPRAQRVGSSVDGVTEDMIAEFSRKPDESYRQYASRLASIRDEAFEYMESHKNDNK